jgi:hypothetical protein
MIRLKSHLHGLPGILTSLVLFCGLASCGYHQAERTVALPGWIRTVYVAPWENRSNELELAAWITDELRQEFLRGSALALAQSDEADVLLEGEVVTVTTSGLSYVRYDQAVERSIAAECAVRLVERKSGRVLWEAENIMREEDFLVGRHVMETEGRKDEALKKISRDVAELIYHRVTGIF